MNDPVGKNTERSGLNPKLKSVENTSRDTETSTRPPAESASVQHDDSRAWPIIWIVVTVICVLVAAYLLLW
ncbi:hypothetical protein [Jannaschia rubra]|uniref:Uncharacterized protein n=1 Tax=Jannaschia rubra TaxID=282197 RepID=A0A0M6XVP0_9RHOB|nr:hypothetical protein [Jannaschia rubra]CTQ34351.1 hypothetical protein JAN5088_03146 [Jannaschia rubra]SFG63057.1 hypothetical protein SAMN04488517_10885 [Jannaschia rubra]